MSGRKRTVKTELIQKLGVVNDATDREVLSFILRHLDPNRDSEKLSAELLDRFGRFSDVLDTPAELLAAVDGMDERLAGALASYPDVFRYYQESKNLTRSRILDTYMAFNAVQSKFYGRKNEILVLLILDSKGYLRYMGVVAEGSAHSVPLYIREIIRLCLLYQADTVYIAHNHPGGNCTPSESDIVTTKEIDLALSAVDVSLSDHFIFTDEDYLSMRSCGVLQQLRNEVNEFKKRVIRGK